MPTALAVQPGIILFLALGAILKLFSIFVAQKSQATAEANLLKHADIQSLFLFAVFLTLSMSLPALVLPCMLLLLLVFSLQLLSLPLSLQTLLPSLILGTSLYWESVLPGSGIETGLRHNFTLGLIGLGFGISGILPLLKRTITGFWPQLGITAALSILGSYLLTEHLLIAPKLFAFSLCFLLSAFVTQTFAHCKKQQAGENGLLQLAILGILTLFASRLFGSYGWVVLATGLLVNTTATPWQTFGLFWIGRTLLQCFLYLHNSNVTGINLNHPYVSAALFASLLLGSMASTNFIPTLASTGRSASGRIATLTLVAIILPLLSAYLFHEEATGAFLIGFLTIACFQNTQNTMGTGIASLLSMAVLMILTLILVPDSFTWGNSATTLHKLLTLGVFFALSVFALRFLSTPKPSSSAA